MNVPFVDLEKQYRSIQAELDQGIAAGLNEFRFIRGQAVENFEHAFAETTRSAQCIATSNGTSSIFIILKALGITAGDEVITPAFSWISTSETVSLCNATPVFADVDEVSYTVSAATIEKKITAKTKAVIVVHLYGQCAALSEISALCEKHNLFLIEDCAQAHLTSEGNAVAGTIGHAAAFSFYPTKNLGAYGDAGCILTNDQRLAEKMRRYANHGAMHKDDHVMEGINSRMDTIQAAVLLAKLPFLQHWNNRRRENASLYTKLLSSLQSITLPAERKGTTHTFHQYVIRSKVRDELKAWLETKGVQTVIHYPKALTNLSVYAHLVPTRNEFPVSNALENEVLSLPITPEATDEQIAYVCRNIQEFYAKVKPV